MAGEADPAPTRPSRCPECGAEATEQSLLWHDLSDMGYLHDDQKFECRECEHRYTHGVPLGVFEPDTSDLWCPVCDLGYLRVHRVEPQANGVRLHLKCPNHYEFDCPDCAERIGPNAVVATSTGAFVCPECLVPIDRADIPFCFFFRFAHRTADDDGLSLVGYPDLVGETAGARQRGYAVDDAGKPVLRPE